MAHPQAHAESSAKRFGGIPEDYIHIHSWFDQSKAHYAQWSHRALRHHTFGIFECEQKFGVTIINSMGKEIPVRVIAEQHVREDCDGRIPSVQDWLENLKMAPWMGKRVSTSPEKRPLGEYRKMYAVIVPSVGEEPTNDEIIHALQMEVSKRVEHQNHGRGCEEYGPDEPDCPCRNTTSEKECSETGCGYCISSYQRKLNNGVE